MHDLGTHQFRGGPFAGVGSDDFFAFEQLFALDFGAGRRGGDVDRGGMERGGGGFRTLMRTGGTFGRTGGTVFSSGGAGSTVLDFFDFRCVEVLGDFRFLTRAHLLCAFGLPGGGSEISGRSASGAGRIVSSEWKKLRGSEWSRSLKFFEALSKGWSRAFRGNVNALSLSSAALSQLCHLLQ